MTVQLDELAIDELLYAIGGPVMAEVELTAHAITEVAKTLIHTSPDAHADGSPHLAETGHVIPARGVATIIFDADYAAAYHDGARPHQIVAKNARALAFRWPARGSGVFFFAAVNHPGNKPHPFLIEAAEIIAQAPLA